MYALKDTTTAPRFPPITILGQNHDVQYQVIDCCFMVFAAGHERPSTALTSNHCGLAERYDKLQPGVLGQSTGVETDICVDGLRMVTR